MPRVAIDTNSRVALRIRSADKAKLMAIAPWHEEPIGRQHERKSFDCGQPELNDFSRTRARQSHERGAAKTFLAIDDADGKTVFGYYCLSPASVEYLCGRHHQHLHGYASTDDHLRRYGHQCLWRRFCVGHGSAQGGGPDANIDAAAGLT